jgi:preprotein translocase subunit SecY
MYVEHAARAALVVHFVGAQLLSCLKQGCQMVYFETNYRSLGTFWRVLQWKMLVYFMDIWSILRPLHKFYGHLLYFVAMWSFFPRFGILYQEKSGNPGQNRFDNLKSSGFNIYGLSPFVLLSA